jgi:hypothetical protein
MTKEVGDWGVKAKNTTWYLNFFMVQYENEKWVEHFFIIREVILQLTK